VIGAGDVEKIAGWAREEFTAGSRKSGVGGRRSEVGRAKLPRLGTGTTVRFDEPLAKKTTMKVGEQPTSGPKSAL